MKLFIINACIAFSLLGGFNAALAQQKKKSKINDIPGENCYLTGEVVKVIKKLDKNNPDSPCGKVPCMAKVRVVKVMGYGPNFYGALDEDDVIKVKFVLTLGPTSRELFPTMKTQYPGLAVGDYFTAYVKAYMLPKDKKVYYTIADYKPGR